MAPLFSEDDRIADKGRTVIGWKLDRAERAELLRQFVPRFEDVKADHVTLEANLAADAPLPEPVRGEIVGHATDGRGVEALVVAIAGSTRRPDGSTYHITWSLAEGRRAKESNDVIAHHGWRALEAAIAIDLQPGRWP
jgi:hypothetical protein